MENDRTKGIQKSQMSPREATQKPCSPSPLAKWLTLASGDNDKDAH